MKAKNRANQVEVSHEINVQEAARQLGRRGGTTTRDRYQGTGFYQRIGRMGGLKFAALYRDMLSEFGKRGGRPRRVGLNESAREEDQQ